MRPRIPPSRGETPECTGAKDTSLFTDPHRTSTTRP